ncbi:hypothetical protein JYT84_00460, partial [bacterium AH-315-M10]|nr:hypothetical protein [bacterium AH-315-M10]
MIGSGGGPTKKLIILALALLTPLLPAQAQDTARVKVQRLLRIALDPKSSVESREAATTELKKYDPFLSSGTLAATIRRGSQLRKSALILAATLRVPGLSRLAVKYITTLEREVVGYCAVTPDPGAAAYLIKRWTNAGTSFLSRQTISKQLKKAKINALSLLSLRKALGTARGKEASEILKFQLGLTGIKSPADVIKIWPQIRANLKAYSTTMRAPLGAIDVLRHSSIWSEEGEVRRVGKNLYLGRDATLK